MGMTKREKLRQRIHSTLYSSGHPAGVEPHSILATSKIMELFDETIEEIIRPHLEYCEKQNGLPYCKNCGLSELEEEMGVKNEL